MSKELEDIKAKAMIIKIGDDIEIPEFSKDSVFGKTIIHTMEEAYLLGWHTAILTCGEILSKP